MTILPILKRLAWTTAAVVASVAAFSQTAAAAPFEDTMAQRMIACSACHGAQGRATPDGYFPRIAGKPAGYLYNQLLNFRDNRRHYGMMTRMVDPLTDAYLWQIAQYFSALDLPYPAPPLVTADAATLARGQALVHQGDAAKKIPACVSCHGSAMTGVTPNIPGLLGVPRDYINGQIGAWKSGQRAAHAPDCMAQISQRLSTDDVHALSSYLSAQPLPSDPHPVAANARPLPMDCGSARLPAGSKDAAPTAPSTGARQ